MLNHKYLSESDRKLKSINEIEYKRRAILDKIENSYLTNKYCTYEQQKVLKDYFNHIIAQGKAKSAYSIRNQIANLALFSQEIKKPYSMITVKDINKYIASQVRKCKFNTVNTRKDIIKRFFEWIERPEVVEHIVIKPMENNKLRKEDLLSKKDIRDMITACCTEIYKLDLNSGYNANVDTGIRDKTVIMILYELGCRRSEVSSINIKDLEDKDTHFLVTIRGKTGERTLPLVETMPYLRNLLKEHPYRFDVEAPLFISVKNNQWGRRLLAHGVNSIVKKASKRANLNKRVYPHLFRHTRATYFSFAKKWTERELRLWFGWTANSNMPNRYVHFAQQEVNKRYIKDLGIFNEAEEKKNEVEDKILNIKKCNNCGHSNSATATYCECGYPLDIKEFNKHRKTINETDNLMNELFSDNEFKELVKEFLKRKLKR